MERIQIIPEKEAVKHLSEEEIQLVLKGAPKVFKGNNVLVATGQ